MSPGCKIFTDINPIVTATAVVRTYIVIVLPPIRDNFFVSDKDATPVINDERTNGTAINFNKLRNIFPKGAIHSLVKLVNP